MHRHFLHAQLQVRQESPQAESCRDFVHQDREENHNTELGRTRIRVMMMSCYLGGQRTEENTRTEGHSIGDRVHDQSNSGHPRTFAIIEFTVLETDTRLIIDGELVGVVILINAEILVLDVLLDVC